MKSTGPQQTTRSQRAAVGAPLVGLLVEAAILHTKADIARLDRAAAAADLSNSQRAVVTTPESVESA